LKSTFHGSSGGSIIEAFANNTQGDGSPGITTNAVVIVSLRWSFDLEFYRCTNKWIRTSGILQSSCLDCWWGHRAFPQGCSWYRGERYRVWWRRGRENRGTEDGDDGLQAQMILGPHCCTTCLWIHCCLRHACGDLNCASGVWFLFVSGSSCARQPIKQSMSRRLAWAGTHQSLNLTSVITQHEHRRG